MVFGRWVRGHDRSRRRRRREKKNEKKNEKNKKIVDVCLCCLVMV